MTLKLSQSYIFQQLKAVSLKSTVVVYWVWLFTVSSCCSASIISNVSRSRWWLTPTNRPPLPSHSCYMSMSSVPISHKYLPLHSAVIIINIIIILQPTFYVHSYAKSAVASHLVITLALFRRFQRDRPVRAVRHVAGVGSAAWRWEGAVLPRAARAKHRLWLLTRAWVGVCASYYIVGLYIWFGVLK